MLKSGIIPAKKHELNTKVIYDSEHFIVIAEKIMNAFDVGDLIKLYGVEKIKYANNCVLEWLPPQDISCEIVGVKDGFIICYPKGYLVVEWIIRHNEGTREYKWRIGVNENKKHFYEIWRSK